MCCLPTQHQSIAVWHKHACVGASELNLTPTWTFHASPALPVCRSACIPGQPSPLTQAFMWPIKVVQLQHSELALMVNGCPIHSVECLHPCLIPGILREAARG